MVCGWRRFVVVRPVVVAVGVVVLGSSSDAVCVVAVAGRLSIRGAVGLVFAVVGCAGVVWCARAAVCLLLVLCRLVAKFPVTTCAAVAGAFG